MSEPEVELPPIPEGLRSVCPICKGSGQREQIGFASAGHMDSGSSPAFILRTCHPCKGKGYVLPAQEELVERIALLEQSLAEANRTIAAQKDVAACWESNANEWKRTANELESKVAALQSQVASARQDALEEAANAVWTAEPYDGRSEIENLIRRALAQPQHSDKKGDAE